MVVNETVDQNCQTDFSCAEATENVLVGNKNISTSPMANTDQNSVSEIQSNETVENNCESSVQFKNTQNKKKSRSSRNSKFKEKSLGSTFDCNGIEIIEVRRVNFSKSSTLIPIQIKNKNIRAVMDSGAQVTILSEKIFNELPAKPPVVGRVKLRMADGNTLIDATRVGPVAMKIGNQWYHYFVIVAPLAEDMLFGHDILKSKNLSECTMDFLRGVLYFDGQIILTVDDGGIETNHTKVKTCKRIRIPAGSIKRVACTMEKGMGDYIVETFDHLKVIAPKVLRKGGTDPIVCFVNTRDRPVTIKKGQYIGRAFPVDSISDESSDPTRDYDFLKVRMLSEVHDINHLSVGGEESENENKNEIDFDIPEHLTKTFWASAKNLESTEKVELANLLKKYGDVFAASDYDLGSFTEIEHKIDTGDAKPIKLKMRRTPMGFADEEKALLDKMLKAGVIQESTSDWAAAPVLIRKRDGSVRWCIDYRALNSVTVKDNFPLPFVSDCLDTLSGNIWFSKLDANSAYWQIKISEEDRKKTAFLTKYGLYEHVRMGFGLCNAPATFSRVINLILRGLNWKTVLAFLDDILVLGKSFDDHVQNLSEVFEKLRVHGLKLKPKKCELFQKQVEFLGRVVSENGIEMSQKD
ncbi:MAG: reverse transcriptase domain-containing protein, partial [Desulfobacterales bacterium]